MKCVHMDCPGQTWISSKKYYQYTFFTIYLGGMNCERTINHFRISQNGRGDSQDNYSMGKVRKDQEAQAGLEGLADLFGRGHHSYSRIGQRRL